MSPKTRDEDIAAKLAEIERLTSELHDIVDKKENGYHGGVISRKRVEEVWNALSRDEARKIDDIAEKTGIKRAAVQKALYILLAENRAVRARVEMERNIGRPVYEYRQAGMPSVELSCGEKIPKFDMHQLLEAVPVGRQQAMSILDIARKIGASPNTVRLKMMLAEAACDVTRTIGVNDKNQTLMKYYRMRGKPEQPK